MDGAILTLARRSMPGPIRRLIAPVYRNIFEREYQVVLDKNLLQEVMEYLNISRGEAVHMLKLGRKLSAMLWAALNPQTEEEIQEFYEITPFYIFELAYWHMQRRERKRRNRIIKIASGDVLDYGGGIGDLCAILAKRGLNVTYADIRGRTFEFAEWLFQKRSLKVETIDLARESLRREYDTIICLDVIEHLPQPGLVLKDITMHLKKHGKLIINLPLIEEGDGHPMHINGRFDMEYLLNSLGLLKGDKEWLWVKSPQGK
jgi:SAM-dependent methyltransferase